MVISFPMADAVRTANDLSPIFRPDLRRPNAKRKSPFPKTECGFRPVDPFRERKRISVSKGWFLTYARAQIQ